MSAVFVEGGPDDGAIWHLGDPVKEQRALEAGKAFANLGHLPSVAITGADRLTWIHSDRKSTRLNSSHVSESRMPSSA